MYAFLLLLLLLAFIVGAVGRGEGRGCSSENQQSLYVIVSMLTLGKTIMRVDSPVVNIHDVDPLILHEVTLMSIALEKNRLLKWSFSQILISQGC